MMTVAGKLPLREAAALAEPCGRSIIGNGTPRVGYDVRAPTPALMHPHNTPQVGPHGQELLYRIVTLPPMLRKGKAPLRASLDPLPSEGSPHSPLGFVEEQHWGSAGADLHSHG